MPSTDIDGSPILILGREDANTIASLLRLAWHRFAPRTDEKRLADKIKETFDIEV